MIHVRFGETAQIASRQYSYDSKEEIEKFTEMSFETYCKKFSSIIDHLTSDSVEYKGCFCNPDSDSASYTSLPYVAIVSGKIIGRNVWDDGDIVDIDEILYCGRVDEIEWDELDDEIIDVLSDFINRPTSVYEYEDEDEDEDEEFF